MLTTLQSAVRSHAPQYNKASMLPRPSREGVQNVSKGLRLRQQRPVFSGCCCCSAPGLVEGSAGAADGEQFQVSKGFFFFFLPTGSGRIQTQHRGCVWNCMNDTDCVFPVKVVVVEVQKYTSCNPQRDNTEVDVGRHHCLNVPTEILYQIQIWHHTALWTLAVCVDLPTTRLTEDCLFSSGRSHSYVPWSESCTLDSFSEMFPCFSRSVNSDVRPMKDGFLTLFRTWPARRTKTNFGFRSDLLHSNVSAVTSIAGSMWQGKMMSSPTPAIIGWSGPINLESPGNKQICVLIPTHCCDHADSLT